MSLPRYSKAVIAAYNDMNSQESTNDYWVATFNNNNNPDDMELIVHSQGKGGITKVTEILNNDFASGIAVAMFRVTAVDARGTTTSLRTKLIHVIYVGKNTPVMQRAKVASWNKVLKVSVHYNNN
jgi:hypothetical protein